jgi:5-formyltetrahydrofolate cyclo-ligase
VVDGIRRSLRDQRLALDDEARRRAAEAVATHVLPLLHDVTTVGAYLAVGGEVDPTVAVSWLWEHGVAVYVPRVAASRTMVFAQLRAGAAPIPGAYGIPQPPLDELVRPPARLDVVLLPLVAFDRTGTRVGSGAGFYDRAFAFRHDQPWGSRPLLVGLAYSWQELPRLERRSWDVPLDYIATEAELISTAGQPPR